MGNKTYSKSRANLNRATELIAYRIKAFFKISESVVVNLLELFHSLSFFFLHSNLQFKPRSRVLKSKEYVTQNEAGWANLNSGKIVFHSTNYNNNNNNFI